MRRSSAVPFVVALATGLGTALAAPSVHADSAVAPESRSSVRVDDLPNPLEGKRRALREAALTAILNGDARVEQRGASTVVRVGTAASARAVGPAGRLRERRGPVAQYVEIAREDTDRVFAVLAEFGKQRHPDFPDQDTNPDWPGPRRFNGPLHNRIPRPDRDVDNSTIWQPDFSRSSFQELYFGEGAVPGAGGEIESVKTYYERQSSGRYSITGYVSPWVKVRYNEARYGRSFDDPADGDDPAVCADVVCGNTWVLVRHAANRWVKAQRAAGRTPAEIRRLLGTFDEWDRYDHDSDGNFDEPDGYLDHFQVVHAGGDMANQDPWQGEDAIWSHRWYAFLDEVGDTGPAGNLLGGTEIGNTGFWVGDYTIQPENGGMSVFAHEYGHDLGLPDLYDVAADNNVSWWSLMAQSRVSDEDDQGIGTRAQDLGPYEKLQLGWLDYDTMLPRQNRRLWLGPHEYNSRRAQAAVVVLPKKQVTIELVAPYEGERMWWSGMGNDLNNTMTREVTLPAGEATLTMQAQWDIEDCGPDPCDYAYVEVDDGSGWVAIPGSITNPDEGNGIDGTSEGWVPATFDLTAYAGQTIGLRLRYQTDGAVSPIGFFADNITVTSGSEVVFFSGAEDGDEGWILEGFAAVGSSVTNEYDNYYLASHRDYVSFDEYLRTGPYNFGFPERPDFVEHFPYQDGLLVWYWDTSQLDNNTSEHPGEGLVLPVDANPRPRVQLDGDLWRNRVAVYDAPFSLQKSDSFTLHDTETGQENHIRGYGAEPLFQDDQRYWFPADPSAGVKVPENGVNIEVLRQRGTSMKIRVWDRNVN